MREANLDQIIERIYDTALAPENWGEVLTEVSSYLGARGAVIFEVLESENRLIAPYYSADYRREPVEIYLQKFGEFEMRNQIEFAEISAKSSNIELVNDCDLPSFSASARMREAMDMLAEFGIGHRTGAVLNKDSWNIDRFSLQYEIGSEGATEQDKARARVIMPHISKALRIGRPLLRESKNGSDVKGRIQGLDFGVCVVTADCEPIMMNNEFKRILQDCSVMKLNLENHLMFLANDNFDRFLDLIKSIEIHGKSGANPRTQAITLRNETEDDVVFVEVSPASAHPTVGKFPVGCKLITALDVVKIHDVDSELVGRFFPISKSEQDVLTLIAHGYSNAKIAEMRGRSVETVNTQTKSLFNKTYTQNRTELVQLALSLKTPFSMAWI